MKRENKIKSTVNDLDTSITVITISNSINSGCYNSKTLELVNKKNLVRINIRELNRELCTGLSTLNTKI